MRDRHVCILTSAHGPYDTRIFHKQARSYVAAGYRVSLVVPHAEATDRDGVAVHRVRPTRGRLPRMTVGVWRVLRRALQLNADLYHMHDPELVPAGFVLKAMGKRVVFDVHEDTVNDILNKDYLFPPWLLPVVSFAYGAVERAAGHAFDGIVVARDDLVGHFAEFADPTLVRNYPSRDIVGPPPHANGDGHLRVIYVGAMSTERGMMELMDAVQLAAERLPVELHLYGACSPASLEAAIREHPASRHTTFFGAVDYRRIPAILSAADVGVVCFHPSPNHVNSGPTKLFEYMAAGIPCIASDFPMWRDVVAGHGCGICVDPLDARAIADALLELGRDPGARQRMGAAGRRAILDEVNWETEATNLMMLAERVLQRE